MPDLYELVRNFGFPAVVALILLLRVEARLRELTRAVQELPLRLLTVLQARPNPPEGDG